MIRRKMKVSTKKILMVILLTICYSNCTVFRYLYVQTNTWIALVIFCLFLLNGFYYKRGLILKLFSGLTLVVLFNYILSSYKNAVYPYLLIFIFSLMLYGIEFSVEELEFFAKGCFLISLFISITIIIEPFINTFSVDYLWFLGELHSSGITALRINKANEIYISAYSGVAFEKGDAAYYMVLGAAYLLAKYKSTGELNRKEVISGLLFLIAIFLTGKRMLFICFVIITLIMYSTTNKNNKVLKIIAVTVFSLLMLIVLSNFVPAVANMIERFSNASSGQDGALVERYIKWSYAIQLFSNKPFFGYGFGSYNQAVKEVGYVSTFYTHNIYIELLSDTGIGGLIVFLFFAFTSLKKTWNLLKYDFSNSVAEVVVGFSFSVQILILVYGLSGNTLFYRFQLFIYLFSTVMSNIVLRDYDMKVLG